MQHFTVCLHVMHLQFRHQIFSTNMISSEIASGTWDISSVCCWVGVPSPLSPTRHMLSLLAGDVQQVVFGLHDITETRLRTAPLTEVILHRWSKGPGSLSTCAVFTACSCWFPWFYRFEVHAQNLVHLSKCAQPQGKLRKTQRLDIMSGGWKLLVIGRAA